MGLEEAGTPQLSIRASNKDTALSGLQVLGCEMRSPILLRTAFALSC